MALDPQAKAYIERMAALGAPAIETLPAENARRNYAAGSVGRVEDRGIPRPGGEIPIRVYTPAGPGPLPVLVYFHGGGFVIGNLDTHDLTCRVLSEWAGCIVVSVAYRLAPEHPFPAAFEDAWVATAWVAEHAGELKGDPQRVAVGGDSAGGSRAAAVALQARDRGGPKLAYQLLIYPLLDHNFDTVSLKENGAGYGHPGLTVQRALGTKLPRPLLCRLSAPIFIRDRGSLP